jgi:Fe-S-cluster containining protein
MMVSMVVKMARKVPEDHREGKIKELADFPYDWDYMGACEKLNKDRTCSVYEDRPDVCRVDVMYDRYEKDSMSIEEYGARTDKACRSLEKTINSAE